MQNNQIKVLWAAKLEYSPGWKLEDHYHDYYQIVYVLEGQGTFRLGEKLCNIKKKNLVLIHKNEIHSWIVNGNRTLKTLEVKFRINKSLLDKQIKLIKQKDSIFVGNDKLKILLENIREEGLNKKKFYKKLCNLYLYEILIYLLRGKKNTSIMKGKNIKIYNKNPVVQKYIKFIKNNYNKDLSLKEIANCIGYNDSYICQEFKRETRYTPMNYLYKFRIEKAKELIAFSEFNLEQIASKVGYKNVQHFTKSFAKFTGVTPGKYLKRKRRGIGEHIYIEEEFHHYQVSVNE